MYFGIVAVIFYLSGVQKLDNFLTYSYHIDRIYLTI